MSNCIGFAIKLENLRAFWFAYILGIISPINKMIAVITTTWTIKPIMGKSEKSKHRLIMNVEIMIIATFAKLFAISIVASKRFGLPKSLMIISLVLSFRILIFSICEGFNEKKAISEPDINAEHKSKTSISISATTTLKVKGFKRMLTKIQSTHKWGSISGSSKIN